MIFVPYNEVYKQHFQVNFQHVLQLEVARLPRDVKVEIEVIAEV